MKPGRKLAWIMVVIVALFLAAAISFYERPISYLNGFLNLQLHMAGAHSRSVTVNGIRMHYWVLGPEGGTPVVLVHGLEGHGTDFHNLAPFLRQAGFRVYLPDLPGFAGSDKPKDFSYSIPDEANQVVGFMDALGLKQVDLGGHSMGGWIVQHIAYQHPERVVRLMIFDSAGIYHKPDWNTALFAPTTAGELDKLDMLLMPHPPPVPPFVVRDMLRISRRDAWIIHRSMASMLTGRDVTDAELPQLKMPVLIVWGDQDHITPIADGEKMHELVPQSQMDVVQGCGHLAPIQCADRIGPVVAAFLKR